MPSISHEISSQNAFQPDKIPFPTKLRVQKDLNDLILPHGVKIKPIDPNNLMLFDISVNPSDGYWRGLTINFILNIHKEFPFKSPKVTSITKVFHPNIDIDGHVCLNILRLDWRPTFRLYNILLALLNLFLEPEPDEPINKEAALLLKTSPSQFAEMVKLYTNTSKVTNPLTSDST